MRWYAGCMRSEEGIERHRESRRAREQRRIRMRAGGIKFHIGMAPTAESSSHLRQKIKKEAPRG